MRRVELLGASGVGKTTLYKYLDKIPQKNRGYLTIRETYRDAALSQNISIRNLDLIFYQFLLKNNMAFGKERGLGTAIVQILDRKKAVDRNKYNKYSVSFEILCNHLRKTQNPYLIRKRIRNFLDRADKWIQIQTYLKSNRVVLIDEGMLHYHSGIGEYGYENFSREQLVSDEAFSPSGIIYCALDAETVYKQAVKRKKEGIFTFTHIEMEGEELRKFVKETVEQNFKKVSEFQEIGIPVLEINTGNRPSENAKKINEFILSL